MTDTLARLTAALADRYRVERELGQGGMATVYLAHDLKHERDVAIKVLHPDLGAALGAERFLSEIKTTAKLQHPHILPLLDSGAADGLLYYVMPLVTGETLRARLARERQLPIGDAVRLAREVASALDYAHRQSVIHRDIKPENILLQDGSALVADFGIALAVQSAGGQRMTQTGLSLGTPSYMSPEQAMGERTIDARSDVYALGAVTYEMLTGDPPFSGNSVQAIVAKVLSERPVAPHVLRDTVPRHVEAAVLNALAKLPADRFGSANEFADALAPRDGTQSASLGGAAANEWGGDSAPRGAVRRWQAIALVCAVAAAGATTMWLRRTPPADAPIVRFSMPAAATAVGRTTQPALSPDGRIIAYADRTGSLPGIRVRYLDRDSAELVPGTATAYDVTFSPDGKALAYITDDLVVHTVQLESRAVASLATGAGSQSGLTWGDDGFVYFAMEKNDAPLMRVAAAGGTAEAVVAPKPNSVTPTGGGVFRSPYFVRGTQTLLFSISGEANGDGDIVAFDLSSKSQRVVARGTRAFAVHDGWVLAARLDGGVFASPLSGPSNGEKLQAIPILNDVFSQDGESFVALSDNGNLMYQPATSTVAHLVWVSRTGVEQLVDSSLALPMQNLALAPNGQRVAYDVMEANGMLSVWMYDFARRTQTRLSSTAGRAFRPMWTNDGQRVWFSADRGEESAERSLYSKSVDRGDTAVLLLRSKRHVQEMSMPSSGHLFAYREGFSDASTVRDIFVMAEGDSAGRPIAATKANEYNPAVSPDGKWLAYASNTSGRNEVYLTPFPTGGAQYLVSSEGGRAPVWSHSSRELFHRDAQGRIVATEIANATTNPLGTRRVLFDASQYSFDELGKSYDIAPGDDRFIFIKPPPRARINVVLNWWREVAPKLAQAKSGK